MADKGHLEKFHVVALRCLWNAHVLSSSRELCAGVPREAKWNGNLALCPQCGPDTTKKDGHYRSYQKYFCKSCAKSVNYKNGNSLSLLSYAAQQMVLRDLCLFFMRWMGCSIGEISFEVASYGIDSHKYERCNKYALSCYAEPPLFISLTKQGTQNFRCILQ